MSTELTDKDFVTQSSDILAGEEAAVSAAYAQAIAELNRIRGKASADDSVGPSTTHYSMHEAAGFGKYVIPRRTGWNALIDIIHDPVPNIDFSANIYPAFDGVLGDIFDSPYLLDPLHDKYESYESLRDNLAAVRNFLLQTYYAHTPEGMTPSKARQALTEIATFLGDGLLNNYEYYGLIPNHKPFRPFIDIDKAREPGGQGAQYIYQRILDHQRHSSWMRPFDAVKALFGGHAPIDWQLPEASATTFLDKIGHDLADAPPTPEDMEAAQRVDALNMRLQQIRDSRALSTTATDLDAIGNHLIYTAENMKGVTHLSEGLRRDAVDIARDILNKLKLRLGNHGALDALTQMKPSEDMATLGAVKGVAMVYERLLAWARGNNDSAIFQHPSILAANRAIGQLGYLAKTEALRMARVARNDVLVEALSEQLKRLPESYRTIHDATFGGLLDKVERGIDTVINRTQQVSVSGAKVGKSVDNRGTSMDAAPIAGMANQSGAVDAAKQNAALLAAEQLAALAHTQRLSQQAAQAPAKPTQPAAQQTQQAAAQPRGTGAQARPQSTQAARSQRSSRSTSNLVAGTPLPGMNIAQFQDMQRNAALRTAHEREEQHHHEQQQRALQQQQQYQQYQLAQMKANAAIIKARASVSQDMIKGFDLKGIDMSKMVTPGRRIDPLNVMKPTPKAQIQAAQQAQAVIAKAAAPTPEEDKLKQQQLPPQAPRPGSGGRGF